MLAPAVAAGLVVAVSGGVGASVAEPGSPGTMAAPRLVLYEGFENAPPTTATFVQTIDDYPDSAAPTVPGYVGATGQTYDADPGWNGEFCDGLIVTAQDPTPHPDVPQAADCSGAGWSDSLDLAETLGLWAADPDYPYPGLVGRDPLTNHVVTAYTEGDPPPGVMVSTSVAATPGHFYSASIDVAQANCWTENPVDLSVAISDGSGAAAEVFAGPIAACDLPVHQLNGDNVGTFVGRQGVLIAGDDLTLAVRNELGGGGGNDNAIDNLALIDITPQLDVTIAPPPSGDAYPAGSAARLTFTVTNTYLAGFPAVPSGPKPGFSFSASLPARLVAAADPRASTDCDSAAVNAAGPTVSVTASLLGTDVACTVSLDVTSSTSGTYVLDPAAVTTFGVLAPSAASVTFAAVPAPPAPPAGGGGSRTGTPGGLAATGSDPAAAVFAATLIALAGMATLALRGGSGRREMRRSPSEPRLR
ncbi:hypothetical protein WDJ51_04355 [Rathayibacter sp. YIM 133350]|uniref:DUF7933 domain-containing protein n=1 Tax=Rathayibacter sp. YIM 133350 TaxID=3131992 RepID=UPI00307EFA34